MSGAAYRPKSPKAQASQVGSIYSMVSVSPKPGTLMLTPRGLLDVCVSES